MIRYIIILLSLVFALPANSQNCSSYILKNYTNSGIQTVKVKKVQVVFRANHSYSIEVQISKNEISATFYSNNGVRLNKNDELIFISSTGVKKIYPFVSIGKMVKKRDVGIEYSNSIDLALDDLDWLSNNSIKTIYLKNLEKLQMRKFTLSQKSTADFKLMTKCVLGIIDPSNVQKKSKSVAVGSKSKPKKSTGNGSGASNLDDNKEVVSLNAELKSTKASIKAQIQAEYDRLERVKKEVAEEIVELRRKNSLEKQALAESILTERKTANAQLDKIRSERTESIKVDQENYQNQKQKLADNIIDQRKKSNEEISRIKMESQQKVVNIRDSANIVIERAIEKLKNRKLELSDEIASNFEASKMKIKELRSSTDKELAVVRQAAEKEREGTLQDLIVTKSEINDLILVEKEKSIRKISKIKEERILREEKLAASILALNRNAAEKKALVGENLALELAELRINNEEAVKRENLKFKQDLKELAEQREGIKNQIVQNRIQSDSLILSEKNRSTEEIIRTKQEIAELKKQEQAGLKGFKLKIRNERDSLSTVRIKDLATIEQRYSSRRDSIQLNFVAKNKLLKVKLDSINLNFRERAKSIKVRQDSIQNAHQQEIAKIKETFDLKKASIEKKNLDDIAALKSNIEESKEKYNSEVLDVAKNAKNKKKEINSHLTTELEALRKKNFEVSENFKEEVAQNKVEAVEELKSIEKWKLEQISKSKIDVADELEKNEIKLALTRKVTADSINRMNQKLRLDLHTNNKEREQLERIHKEEVNALKKDLALQTLDLENKFNEEVKTIKDKELKTVSALNIKLEAREKEVAGILSELEKKLVTEQKSLETESYDDRIRLIHVMDSVKLANRAALIVEERIAEESRETVQDSISAELLRMRTSFAKKKSTDQSKYEEDRKSLREEYESAQAENVERIFQARELSNEQVQTIKKETRELIKTEEARIVAKNEELTKLEKEIEELKVLKAELENKK